MKKLHILLLTVLSSLTQVGLAQKINESEVPSIVKENFAKKYPGVKALKWEKENSDFEVGFYMDKVQSSAIFDPSGNFKEFEQEMSVSEMPKAIIDYSIQNYHGFHITEAARITDANGKTFYELEMDKGKKHFELLFDLQGNFIVQKEPVKP